MIIVAISATQKHQKSLFCHASYYQPVYSVSYVKYFFQVERSDFTQSLLKDNWVFVV